MGGGGHRREGAKMGRYSGQKFSEKRSHTTHCEAVAKENLSLTINTSEITFLVQNEDRER